MDRTAFFFYRLTASVFFFFFSSLHRAHIPVAGGATFSAIVADDKPFFGLYHYGRVQAG